MTLRNVAIVVTESLWPFGKNTDSPSGNGFHQRYSGVFSALADSADSLSIVILCLDSSQAQGTSSTSDQVEQIAGFNALFRVFRIRLNPRDFVGGMRDQKGRLLNRLFRNLVGRPVFEAWQKDATAALLKIAPTAVVLLNGGYPWTLYRGVADSFATISFVEEDFWVSRMARRLPVHVRSFARFDDFIAKRVYRAADSVVAISPNELRWLQRIFPQSKHHVVPLSIDVEYWSALVNAPVDGEIFTIAGLEPLRGQGDDFTAIVSEIRRQSPDHKLVIRLAGVVPPDPSGSSGRIEIPSVEFLGAVSDPRPFYQGARIILVPAFQVTGVKTTILQAWVAGRPVVTTTAAAHSVGGTHGVNLLAGETPAEVAQMVLELINDHEMQEALVAGGRKAFRDSFSPELVDIAVRDALDGLLG